MDMYALFPEFCNLVKLLFFITSSSKHRLHHPSFSITCVLGVFQRKLKIQQGLEDCLFQENLEDKLNMSSSQLRLPGGNERYCYHITAPVMEEFQCSGASPGKCLRQQQESQLQGQWMRLCSVPVSLISFVIGLPCV